MGPSIAVIVAKQKLGQIESHRRNNHMVLKKESVCHFDALFGSICVNDRKSKQKTGKSLQIILKR